MNATCTVAPPTNSFGTIGCGAATDLRAPQIEQVREILQRFCDHRGADVQVDETDAHRVSDAWWNLDALGIILHTLLQAGLTFADAGMHHARRLANQWRGFYTTQTQGAGKRLSDGSMETAQKENVGHKTVATDAAATYSLHSTSSERQVPTSTSEVNLSITVQRQATQQDASASPARKTEMNVPPRRVRHKAPPVGSTTAPTSRTCRNACMPQLTLRWHMTCRITIAHFEAVGSSVQPKRHSQNTLLSVIRLHYMTWHCGGHHRLAPRKRHSKHIRTC